MAARQSLTTEQIKQLSRKLTDGLKEAGYRASVELEASEASGRYRLYVISQDFDKLSQGERQDVLWRVLKDVWSRADQLRITLSLALSPKEAQGTWS
jgi:hypothetical protein